MELSAKPFLELEEKLELKKYNLARHYRVDPNEITPEFVKTMSGITLGTQATALYSPGNHRPPTPIYQRP